MKGLAKPALGKAQIVQTPGSESAVPSPSPRPSPPGRGSAETNAEAALGPGGLSPMGGGIVLLATDAMQPTRLNRTDLDEKRIDELAADIQSRGVLCPILVRPAKGGDAAAYEIVFGERRWRAAKRAGLHTIPARVAFLTDEEARAARLAENLQREDLSALDEAAAFQEMIASGDCTAETLAEKIHKSRSHVFARLALLGLEKTVRTALASGKLMTSVAELLGRLPKTMQAEAMKEAAFDYRGDPVSYRDAKNEIEENFLIDLKPKAGWDLEDETVCEGTPACETCPKRSGNLPEKPFKNPYICTDPGCFKRKAEAHAAVALAEAKATGQKVLTAAESKKVFGYRRDEPTHESGYVDAGDKCYADDKSRTYGAIAQGKLKDGKAIEPVAAVDAEGNVHRLYRRKEVEALVRKPEKGGIAYSAATKARRAREKLEEKGTLIAVDRIVRTVVARGVEVSVEKKIWLAMIANAASGLGWERFRKRIAERRGIKPADLSAKVVATWELPALRGLFVELRLCDFNGYSRGVAQLFAKELGVDWKGCVKAAKKAEPAGIRLGAAGLQGKLPAELTAPGMPGGAQKPSPRPSPVGRARGNRLPPRASAGLAGIRPTAAAVIEQRKRVARKRWAKVKAMGKP